MFKPSKCSNSGATAEIRNDVTIEENTDRIGETLAIVIAIILIIIALIKITELIIYFVNRCKRSMKKKYEKQSTIMLPQIISNTPTAPRTPTAPDANV